MIRTRCALLFALALLGAATSAAAQVCTADIELTTQAEVDAFDCAEVTGFLAIGGSDITDLTPLSALTSVGDYLSIASNTVLTSLDGLGALSSFRALTIRHNPALTSLDGLRGSTSDRVQLLLIEFNDALISLGGLSGITSDAGRIAIDSNDALTSLDALDGITATIGSLAIVNNDALTSLNGLSSITYVESLAIAENDALVSLDGLDVLSIVGLHVGISGNDALTSLDGLDGLSNVGDDLSISRNATLSRCSCGLAGLISGKPPAFTGVNNSVSIRDNDPNGQCNSPQAVLDDVCVPTDVAPTDDALPEAFAIEAAYPNPFRQSATVTFALPEAAEVRLAVYDLLGREVAVLVEEPLTAGRHDVPFEAAGLARGTYLVRLEAGGQTAVQNLTLLR